MDIKIYLKDKRDLIDAYLTSYFEAPSAPPELHEAMKYSLLAGGKRIRPILAMASYEACGKDAKEIIPQASSLELIHTYSLIHDDLPAMDDDDLRRGKPTNHKMFGEAMAILAGDALLTEAFFMMTNTETRDAGCRIQDVSANTRRASVSHRAVLRSVREVAMAAGACGMVGGQAQDILSEDSEPDMETLEFIHSHKTAALIAASVRMGPILANGGRNRLRDLTTYGECIGLAFQVVDDILDIEGTTEELGKPAGSDNKKKKLTYPSIFGIEGARRKAKELISASVEALRSFSSDADPLREIAGYLGKRRA
jgi:geranylgeranyl diphosphate synthase type II